ncbi:MAG: amidase [Bacteroidia bacterium]|nr:amidase [Bacteroidia bacterium]
METKYGFIKQSIKEFEGYLANLKIARTVVKIQQHHTYIPAYIHFKGSNHFEIQKGMKNTHVSVNGWADIGQQLSIFPDGSIVTGRSFETTPACIFGNNAHAVCIENIGNFDKGGDVMTQAQREAIVAVTAALCKKFNLVPNTNTIVYHHWFNLSTGVRNNGAGGNKSCPGTNFFGGNKVDDCAKNFIPLIVAKLANKPQLPTDTLKKYVVVTASSLNIRQGPSAQKPKVVNRTAAQLGSILRVYEETNAWLRISSSDQHWVAGNYTVEVKRAEVKANMLNIRSGAGSQFPKIDSLVKNTEVFIVAQQDGWSQISMESKWVSDKYLNFS